MQVAVKTAYRCRALSYALFIVVKGSQAGTRIKLRSLRRVQTGYVSA